MSEKITTIAETPTWTLLRIETTHVIGDTPCLATRHEWWYCQKALADGRYGDGTGRIYCASYVGINEAELLQLFKRGAKLNGENIKVPPGPAEHYRLAGGSSRFTRPTLRCSWSNSWRTDITLPW